MNYHAIIIGAGPAGIAAAIQLKRAGVDFMIFEKEVVGGLVLNANLVENYPGFPNGIDGPHLADLFGEHLARLQIVVAKESVFAVDQVGGNFVVRASTLQFETKNLVITSGTKPVKLDSQLCERFGCNKVYYEVYPLREVVGKNIAVIGGGDVAFDYAINLSKNNNIHLMWRSEKPKCLPILYRRASEIDTIKMYPKTEMAKLNEQIQPDCVVVAIGREPNVDFLSPKIKKHFLEKEKINGLYYAGDVLGGDCRQVAIAAGSGMKIAMNIIERINENY